jgi:hypothetical protein
VRRKIVHVGEALAADSHGCQLHAAVQVGATEKRGKAEGGGSGGGARERRRDGRASGWGWAWPRR